jgi:tetratricopeptide (TPR) repeat protein
LKLMSSSSAKLERAQELQRRGSLSEAATLYREVLAGEPRRAEAMHGLGLIMAAMGRGQDAVDLIAAASRLQPSDAAIHANHGIALSELRQFAEAVACFDRAVALQPDLAAGYLGRGSALLYLGQLQQALANLGQAVRLAPKSAQAHNALGVALEQANRLAEARHCFEQVLALDPKHAEAHHNIGLVLAAEGRPAEALVSIERALALQPQHAPAHANRGSQLLALNRPAEALASFERALVLQPGAAICHHNRGLALMILGRREEALASFDRALAVSPGSVAALLWRAKALNGLDRPVEALASLDITLKSELLQFETHLQRGVALAKLERYEESAASFASALVFDPHCAEALNNRGAMLMRLFRPVDALQDIEKAIACRPDYAEAHINACNTQKGLGRYVEALRSIDRALALKPEDPMAIWSKAVLKLALGDFREGWPLYEARFRLPHVRAVRTFDVPRWSGTEPLAGKTLFVHCEQGLGDTLQFCRYLGLLEEQGAQTIFEVQPQLIKLLRTLDARAVIISRGERPPPFDFHTPLLSLPLAFRTDADSIPRSVPYLKVESASVRVWQERLATLPGFRVGLNWYGNPGAEKHSVLQARSFPLSAAAALTEIPGISLVSLQKGAGAEQLAQVAFGGSIAQLTDPQRLGPDEIADETAAILVGLDLVITADTALAHLAGALGVPVWVVLQSVPDWRWLIEREDSPWYPSMRLFRQRSRGDWREVLERVAAELATLALRGGQTNQQLMATVIRTSRP